MWTMAHTRYPARSSSDAKIMQEKPQVAAFINFYLTYVDEEVIGVGYFPAPDAALEEAKSHWAAAMQ